MGLGYLICKINVAAFRNKVYCISFVVQVWINLKSLIVIVVVTVLISYLFPSLLELEFSELASKLMKGN